jgi:hypothetical protein
VSASPGVEPSIDSLRAELAELRDQVRRLERRLNSIEPETTPGVVVRSQQQMMSGPSESPILDAVGDALEAFGFGKRE